MTSNLLFIWLYLSAATFAFAQLSPGDLHKSHKQLEGIENCTKCHEAGQGLSDSKCLDCHNILKKRVDKGLGLHAQSGFKKCEKCHVEHQGRNFDLIFWEGGRDNFDHSKTGYKLQGAHSKLKCRDCHKANHITNPSELKAAKKDLSHTFLGLNQACLSCHRDEHRKQLSENCLTCHNFNNWKSATGFNHKKTRFALTGKHITVKCVSCHKVMTDQPQKDDKDYLKFTGLSFGNCTSCHKDTHQGRLGQNCTRCHSTAGWKLVSTSSFNHDKTGYPLRGKHRTVACASCHNTGRKRLTFGKCTDCHKDFHVGQFADRKQKGNCEECHSVNGFSPANFSIEQHQKTRFALQGSHLAIPCIACHTRTIYRGVRTIAFTFKSTLCQECHKDVHNGQVDSYMKKTSTLTSKNGCQHCHNDQSWQAVTFDHSLTRYKLLGKHAAIACKDCHKTAGQGSAQFTNVGKICSDCHNDVHVDQFEKNGKTDCTQCHDPAQKKWIASLFDHDHDASFALKGAHEKVACTECHLLEKENGREFVRYKPVAAKCSDCHAKNLR